jgi:hypothetical protein
MATHPMFSKQVAAPSIRFEGHSADLAGVTEFFPKDNFRFNFLTAGMAWAVPVISLRGKLFIADAIVQNLDINRYFAATLKYGPGGRRRYVEITAEFLDALVNRASWSNDYRSSRDGHHRNEEIGALALALIDLLATVQAGVSK